jgi:hypothetical protein
MATLTPTLTLESTDATSDTLSFSVTDTLTVTDPQIGLSKIAASTTGGNSIILPSVDAVRYVYIKHTAVDGSGSATSQLLNVETADNTVVCTLGAGEFMFAPIHDGDATLIQLEAASGTIVAEYAYWTKG